MGSTESEDLRDRPGERRRVFGALRTLGVGTVTELSRDTGLTVGVVWGVIQSSWPQIEAAGFRWHRKRSGNLREVRVWRVAHDLTSLLCVEVPA